MVRACFSCASVSSAVPLLFCASIAARRACMSACNATTAAEVAPDPSAGSFSMAVRRPSSSAIRFSTGLASKSGFPSSAVRRSSITGSVRGISGAVANCFCSASICTACAASWVERSAVAANGQPFGTISATANPATAAMTPPRITPPNPLRLRSGCTWGCAGSICGAGVSTPVTSARAGSSCVPLASVCIIADLLKCRPSDPRQPLD